MKRERRLKLIQEQSDHDYVMPEKKLWLAVIDRAIKDYCWFFDKVCSSNNCNSLIGYKEEHHINAPRILAELNRLQSFLFAEEPEEFNLSYLSEHLFDDPEGMSEYIRNQCRKLFLGHLRRVKEQGIYPHLIDFVINHVGKAEVLMSVPEYVMSHQRRSRSVH